MNNVIPIKKARDTRSERIVAEHTDMNRARMAIDTLKASNNPLIQEAVKLLTAVCNEAQTTTIAEESCRHEWQSSAGGRWCNLCGRGV